MKENNELERKDVGVDAELLVETPNVISAYIETWFDTDRKFGTQTDDDDKRVDFYADYDIEKDNLKLFYLLITPHGTAEHKYNPIGDEAQIIKEAIAEKIKEVYDKTPKEFCDEVFPHGNEPVYIYIKAWHNKKHIEDQLDWINKYMDEQGYISGGEMIFDVPLSQCEDYPVIINYCKTQNISKFVVNSIEDIANNTDGARAMLRKLRDDGISVEMTDVRYLFLLEEIKNEQPTETINQDIKMGGM